MSTKKVYGKRLEATLGNTLAFWIAQLKKK